MCGKMSEEDNLLTAKMVLMNKNSGNGQLGLVPEFFCCIFYLFLGKLLEYRSSYSSVMNRASA